MTAVTTSQPRGGGLDHAGRRADLSRGWERFASVARPGERPVEAYARLLRHPDPRRARAIRECVGRVGVDPRVARPELDAGRPQVDDLARPGRTSRRSSRTTGPTTASFEAASASSTGWESSPASRACSSTVATTSADRSSRPGSCIGGGPAVASTIVETEGHGGPEMMELTAAAIERVSCADRCRRAVPTPRSGADERRERLGRERVLDREHARAEHRGVAAAAADCTIARCSVASGIDRV